MGGDPHSTIFIQYKGKQIKLGFSWVKFEEWWQEIRTDLVKILSTHGIEWMKTKFLEYTINKREPDDDLSLKYCSIWELFQFDVNDEFDERWTENAHDANYECLIDLNAETVETPSGTVLFQDLEKENLPWPGST